MHWTPAHTQALAFVAACGLSGGVIGFLVTLFRLPRVDAVKT